jgi:hypothetical protein
MGVALGQIVPHVQEDGKIGLEDFRAYVELLDAALGDTGRIATTEQKMPVIEQKNSVFSQYYCMFQLIMANLDWNPSALWIAFQMGLSKEITDYFTYSNMPGIVPAFMTVCQKKINQIRQ